LNHPIAALAASSTALLLASTALAETKTYDLSGFSGVHSYAGVEVEVEVGPEYSVTLETRGDADEASVEVDGDVLKLGRESRRGMNFSFGRGQSFVFTVTMPAFESGKASSGSDLRIEGINGGRVELEASSGGDLEAEGSCSSLTAEASSGSDVRAFDLECDDVKARASSGGEVEVYARQSIDAKASSGGDVDVRGNPDRRNTSESSGGDVDVSNR
jgi:hypothetical protein